jgi:membrane protease YdiL (CAAX protease family)
MFEQGSWVAIALLQWTCCVAVGLPVYLVATRRTTAGWRTPVWLAVWFLGFVFLAHLPPIWPFRGNLWQTMTLQGILGMVLVAAGGSLCQAGVTWRIPSSAWAASAATTGLFLLFVVARRALIRLAGLGPGDERVPIEFLVYQLTAPGFAEELFYRGVVQPRLNEILGRPWNLLGAQVGWGWVITSIIFWAPHAFRVDRSMHLSFYWPTLSMQLFAGFVYGWIRERAGSVLPPILTHNLVNVVWSLV